MSEIKKPFIWKRKRMSEEAYLNRLRLSEIGKNLRKCEKKIPEFSNLQNDCDDGRRIVHINTIADRLFCEICKEILSLQDRIDSMSQGAATIFVIRCRKCLAINRVPSDKKHISPTGKLHFDVNTKLSIGALHSGLGNTHVNKLFAALNLPSISSTVFKRHEREAGLVGEQVAKETCKSAAILERELTVRNEKEIVKLLPDNLKTGFMVSNSPNYEKPIVRFAASFDLGWSTRGTGRNYDSLNGFGALFGRESGKVLDFSTKQRKCRKCDLGHSRNDHDCRCNFEGSAKAMEPKAAVDVAVNSLILKECNMEIGILIGDDDCSTIAAVRRACNREVVEFSDKNHVSKGLTNELYELKFHHKELTTDAIKYLHRCFTYCLEQNRGLSVQMALSIKSIPDHCFNNHDNCGDWCSYLKNGDNYKHKIIADGFKSQKLFIDLSNLFYKFAENSYKFLAVASSQSNESLNATMASKAPKAQCYSTSESASFRYAYSVCQKNIGEEYVSKIAKELCMSPGKNTEKHINKVNRTALARSVKSKTPEFKKRRLFLKKRKSQLRNKKEKSEGIIYQSNLGLMCSEDINNNLDIVEFQDSSLAIVYFDLETSGFGKNAEILQIAAMCGDLTFSIYINPQHDISPSALAVTGLTVDQGHLLLHDNRVDTVTLYTALQQFYSYLVKMNKKSILTAHNYSFDKFHFLNSVESVNMTEYFKAVVYGFADTLHLIKKKTGIHGKGQNSLSGLANSLNISDVGAHNAVTDVKILYQVLRKLDISENKIVENVDCWQKTVEKRNQDTEIINNLRNLIPLRNCISYVMKKKMSAANITFEMIVEAYKTKKIEGLKLLLGADENNVIKVTKSKKVIARLADFLEKIE